MRKLLSALATIGLAFVSTASFAQDYTAGQVWQYKNRSQDSGSLLKIQKTGKIGPENDRMIVYHLSIIGINVPGMDGTLSHLPVSKQTLDESVTMLANSAIEFPDPSEGIRMWREANGGIFTIPIAEIVGILEQSIPSGTDP